MTNNTSGKRRNIYFRQTPKEFRASAQNEIYSHIKRNLPYRIYRYSQERFKKSITFVNNFVSKRFIKKIKV